MSYYPACPEGIDLSFFLGTIIKHLEENPDYLDDPECPYEDDTRKILLRLVPKGNIKNRIKEIQTLDPEEDRWEFLDREVQSLYNDLKKQAEVLGTSTSSEKMSYFRTATSLLEKLVSLQERTVGLKRIGEFHTTVMEVMDDILSPDQRTTVMKKLEDAITN